jgi:hypothetical protein
MQERRFRSCASIGDAALQSIRFPARFEYRLDRCCRLSRIRESVVMAGDCSSTDRLTVSGAYRQISRKTAIRATGPDGKQQDRGPGARRFPELARRGDWSLHDIACRHDIMIDEPAELTAILLHDSVLRRESGRCRSGFTRKASTPGSTPEHEQAIRR